MEGGRGQASLSFRSASKIQLTDKMQSVCVSLSLSLSLSSEHPPSTSAHSLDRVTLSPQQLALCLENSDICSQFLDTLLLSMPIL